MGERATAVVVSVAREVVVEVGRTEVEVEAGGADVLEVEAGVDAGGWEGVDEVVRETEVVVVGWADVVVAAGVEGKVEVVGKSSEVVVKLADVVGALVARSASEEVVRWEVKVVLRSAEVDAISKSVVDVVLACAAVMVDPWWPKKTVEAG